jgi:hypothetical protein
MLYIVWPGGADASVDDKLPGIESAHAAAISGTIAIRVMVLFIYV